MAYDESFARKLGLGLDSDEWRVIERALLGHDGPPTLEDFGRAWRITEKGFVEIAHDSADGACGLCGMEHHYCG